MDLVIRMLGPFGADVEGRPADLGGPRQRSVLALLLVARGEVVSVDRLIDDLWRGEPPPRATGSLQVFVANLRRALEPQRAPRTPSRYLISAAPGYALRAEPGAVDAWHFEQLLRDASASDDAARGVAILEQALGLWHGPALAEFAEESWAAPEAARLDELRLAARERLADARVRAGQAAEAVVEAESLVREAPLREEGWRLLALGQYLNGRQGDALATLRRARAVLSDELGVDPGPRLAALERDVRAQRVELPPAAPARGAALPPAPAAGAGAPSAAGAVSPGGPSPTALFGRSRELALLTAAAAAARPGLASLALVAGEPGGGKSALLARLRTELGAAGWRVVVGRCPEDDSGPPARAWGEALRALAAETDPGELTDALGPILTADAPPDDAGNVLLQRFRLHRAAHEWLSRLGDRPLALLLDDVHRADFETRALLAGLLEQGLAPRTLVVLAYRPEPAAPLDDLLATVARYEPTRVRLGGLPDDAVAELIASITGSTPGPALVRALAERTDGNPFYLKESARLLVSEGELVATSQVPQGVADVLRRRLARLPEESVSILRLASVIGRDVDVALLVRAAEVGEDDVLDALESGLISELLVETGPGAVRFSHLLVRETLYGGVPALRRVRWHARVAAAVAELYPGDLTALAHHAARAATPLTAAAAARHCVAAARLAASRFSYDSAAEFHAEAARCLRLQPEPDPVALVDVLIDQVQAMIRSGATGAAIAVRREAVDVALRSGRPVLLARAVSAGVLPAIRGNLRAYGRTDHELVAVIEGVLREPDLDPALRCRTLCTLVRETSLVDDPRAEPALLEALELARAVGDPELTALTLWSGGEVYLADLHPAQREAIRLELDRLLEDLPSPVFHVLARVMAVNRACVELDIAAAREHNRAAQALARKYQLRQGVFITTVLDAMLAHLGGDLDRAEAMFVQEFEAHRLRGTVDADAALLLSLVTVRYSQGRLPELVEQMSRVTDEVAPAAGHLLALGLALRGDHAAARRRLEATPAPVHDYLWLLLTTARALAVAEVSAVDRAGELYRVLLPFRGRIAGGGTNGYVLTPVARALGRLALLLGRPDDARAHLEQARVVAERCGSRPWLDQVAADLALLDAAAAGVRS